MRTNVVGTKLCSSMVLIIFPRDSHAVGTELCSSMPKGEKAEVKQIKDELPSYMG